MPSPPPTDEKNMVFYDGSSRSDNKLAGAGAALYVEGEEIGTATATIPYGTNNRGECSSAMIGLILAKRSGLEEVAMVGDCSCRGQIHYQHIVQV